MCLVKRVSDQVILSTYTKIFKLVFKKNLFFSKLGPTLFGTNRHYMRPIKYGLYSYPEHVYMWFCLRPAAPGADFGGLKLITRFFRILLKKKKIQFFIKMLEIFEGG